MKISENVKKVIIVASVTVALILLLIFAGPPVVRALVYLFGLMSPFVIGYITAKIINPIADKLRRYLKIPRGISAVLVIILVISVLFGVLGILVYKLFDEARNLYMNWEQIFASLRAGWYNFTESMGAVYIEMPDFVRTVIDKAINGIYMQCIELTGSIPVVDFAQVVAKSLPSGLIWLIMYLLSLYFMVSQNEKLSMAINKILGVKGTARVTDIKNQCKKYLGGYVKAQLILMVIIFFIILIILSLADAPFALLVAVITAFLDALPFFGSGIVLMPLAVIYLIGGQLKLGVVYVITYVVIMVLRRFIEPKLVSDKIGLNPIITLVFMYVGYKLWGIIGLITGPLLLMLIISIYKVGLFKRPIAALGQLLGFAVKEFRLFEQYINEIMK